MKSRSPLHQVAHHQPHPPSATQSCQLTSSVSPRSAPPLTLLNQRAPPPTILQRLGMIPIGPLRSARAYRTSEYRSDHALEPPNDGTVSPRLRAEPPETLGYAAQGLGVLPAEAFPGWPLHRCVYLSFIDGIDALGCAEVVRVTEYSTDESTNGREPQVSLLKSMEGFFQLPVVSRLRPTMWPRGKKRFT